MSLTVLRQLLDRHGINPRDVGRLEVGTESSVDDSKGIKTYLMNLFEDSGNSDIEVGRRRCLFILILVPEREVWSE